MKKLKIDEILGHYNNGPKTLAGKSEIASHLYSKLSLIYVMYIPHLLEFKFCTNRRKTALSRNAAS